MHRHNKMPPVPGLFAYHANLPTLLKTSFFYRPTKPCHEYNNKILAYCIPLRKITKGIKEPGSSWN